jgi:anti-anti-sigma factor
MPEASIPSSSLAASGDATSSRSSTLLCTWRQGSYGACWIHVAGELSFTTSRQLRSTLAEAQLIGSLLVLDLRGLTLIELAGMQVILDAADRARRRGGQLVLLRGRAEVDRVFKVTGACEKVTILDPNPTEPGPAPFDLKRSRACA